MIRSIVQASVEMFKSDELATKFLKDEEAQKLVKNTVKLSGLKAADFDAIFYVGGHGPIVDLAVDEDSINLIQDVSMTVLRFRCPQGFEIGSNQHCPTVT